MSMASDSFRDYRNHMDKATAEIARLRSINAELLKACQKFSRMAWIRWEFEPLPISGCEPTQCPLCGWSRYPSEENRHSETCAIPDIKKAIAHATPNLRSHEDDGR